MGVHLVEVHSHLRAYTARLVRLVADAEADVAKVGIDADDRGTERPLQPVFFFHSLFW